ncbi:hypothetical protein CHH55_01390 [Niallia circulans]|uniref:hypothetical protein n=1 Tax=Niallia circulans TaxID=1397 RepID=UPI000BA794C2|nr:hypothetical protein [Niallia circulans]PAD27226.1 hypothetical protein CHH62_03765 [Niallia circulans]PAD89618.1 hypothetical protein CHH55_01390 [Niallia circulans]
MRKVKKVIIICFILFLATTFIVKEANAASTDTIKITTEAGLAGKVMDGRGFQLKVTMENTGEDFKGDLLIPYSPSYEAGGQTLVSVDIPANSKKTYMVTIPGISSDTDYANKKMKLYRGSWQNGDEVTFTGVKEVRVNLIPEQTLGILTDQYDKFKDLRKLPSNSIYTTEMIKEEIPDQALALETISYLLVDQFSLSELTDEQQQAIKKWIENGGILITGAQPNGKQAYGHLETSMPLALGKKEPFSLTVLDTKNKQQAKIDGYQSTLIEGAEAIVLHNDQPIIAKKELGEGKIIQASFSLSDSSFLGWSGFNSWIEKILLAESSQHANNSQYNSNPIGDLYNSFVQANEYFESSTISTSILLIILTGYLLVIVPILYVVLKRIDKREHAWWIIPSLSILLSIAVFLTGAKDKIRNPQFNEMGVYQYSNNYLSGYQATTLLSNKSGDFTFMYDKNLYTPIPFTGYGELQTKAVTKEKIKKNEMIFPDVEYWSSRTMYGKSSIPVEGGFSHKFETTEKEITGSITNHFPYDFSNLFIWSGTEKIELGSLAAGETKKIKVSRKHKYFSKPSDSNQGSYVYDYNGNDLNEYRELVASGLVLNTEYFQTVTTGDPLLIGITNEDIIKVGLTSGKVTKNSTNLIMEPLTIANNFPGPFTLNEGDMYQKLAVIKGTVYNQNFQENDFTLEDGEYLYTLGIPKSYEDSSIAFESITIQASGTPGVKYSIYNKRTGNYEEVKNLFKLEKQKIADYLDENRKITLKVNKATNGDPYMQLPTVKVKGEIKE